jgi:hypothetical protein
VIITAVGTILPTSQPGLGGLFGQQPAVCPNVTFTCSQLLTCGEALGCLLAGNTALDPNFNGIPCEETLCSPAAIGGGAGGGAIPPTAAPTVEFDL